ncbi:hypothetical protein JNW90_23590 [Micromonospora sp. STR1s_5]|nr:hypothetical protein [Micromonospora sp. STR1s_5]
MADPETGSDEERDQVRARARGGADIKLWPIFAVIIAVNLFLVFGDQIFGKELVGAVGMLGTLILLTAVVKGRR